MSFLLGVSTLSTTLAYCCDFCIGGPEITYFEPEDITDKRDAEEESIKFDIVSFDPRLWRVTYNVQDRTWVIENVEEETAVQCACEFYNPENNPENLGCHCRVLLLDSLAMARLPSYS